MGLPRNKKDRHTIEDWKNWEGRWELIQGVAYDMTPAPSTVHQKTSISLSSQLHMKLEEFRRKGGDGSCSAFYAPTDVYLNGHVVQPDILVVCKPEFIHPHGIEGPPDLVIEILSPSTALKDMNTKRDLYESYGVTEYLIVDPTSQKAVLLKLQDGRYQNAGEFEWGEMLNLLGGRLQIELQ